jgi:hypothetical protein
MSYFDQEGKPITHDQWSELWGDLDERQFRKTTIGRFFISTVWLGMNHRYNDGPPLIFETMIFDEKSNSADIGCQRYSTKVEAIAGHEDAIRWVKKHRLLYSIKKRGYWPE